MGRATWGLAATSVAGLAASIWLFVDNRALRDQLAARPAPAIAAPTVAARTVDAPSRPSAPARSQAAPAAPSLPEPPKESRLERRARRMDEFAATFGRLPGESAEDFKARVGPMIATGLVVPRMRAEEQRREAQDKAHVTPEQAAKLDKAFDKIYADALDYTNKAVADGQLSPYERNVSGWLEYAGGLGGILNDANAQIGKILAPTQVKALADAGFEWGEYFAVKAPWEQLEAPPPKP